MSYLMENVRMNCVIWIVGSYSILVCGDEDEGDEERGKRRKEENQMSKELEKRVGNGHKKKDPMMMMMMTVIVTTGIVTTWGIFSLSRIMSSHSCMLFRQIDQISIEVTHRKERTGQDGKS